MGGARTPGAGADRAGGHGPPGADPSTAPDAPPRRYRIEWRHRRAEVGGARLEVTRAREVAGAAELRRIVEAEADDAVDREFMVADLDGRRGLPPACLRAEEFARWDPSLSPLPVPAVETWWLQDVDLLSHRYRLLAVVTGAFAEARTLRLVGRRRSRVLMASCREALLGGSA